MSAATATKVERVVEGFEALALAVNAAVAEKGHPETLFKNVEDARGELREAFGELMKPTLRVVSGDQ